jgi:hypothetical protein
MGRPAEARQTKAEPASATAKAALGPAGAATCSWPRSRPASPSTSGSRSGGASELRLTRPPPRPGLQTIRRRLVEWLLHPGNSCPHRGTDLRPDLPAWPTCLLGVPGSDREQPSPPRHAADGGWTEQAPAIAGRRGAGPWRGKRPVPRLPERITPVAGCRRPSSAVLPPPPAGRRRPRRGRRRGGRAARHGAGRLPPPRRP